MSGIIGEAGSKSGIVGETGVTVGSSICQVYNSAATAVTESDSDKITFNTKVIDTRDEFDLTYNSGNGYRFVAKSGGMYWVHFSVTLQDFEDGKAMQAQIRINGATEYSGDGNYFCRVNNGRADHCTASVTSLHHIEEGTYFEGGCWHNNSSYRNTTGNSGDTFMSIVRLK